jgi:hypothetical protein
VSSGETSATLRFAAAAEGLHPPGRMAETDHFLNNNGRARVIAVFAGKGNYDYDIRDIGLVFNYGVIASGTAR